MESLDSFMESLTQEQDKLVQMGNIKGKDQALSIGVLNALKGNPKHHNLKLPEKKKPEKTQIQWWGFKSSQGEGQEGKREDQMHLFPQGMASI